MLCPSCGRDNPPEATFCMACTAKLDSPIDETPPHGMATSADFVGRQRELGELGAALDDAIAGRGRMVMLVGEPGIGKTRTARELAAHAVTRGAEVLWGRCREQQGAPPYWPWVQPIRSYIGARDAEVLRTQMGPGAADMADIIPEIQELFPDLGSPPVLESDAARFRLFNSITTFLKNAAQGQPLMIVLDNLHWADTPSLLLLEFLASELEHSHILVVGTYRDVELSRGHPLAHTLGELTRESGSGGFQRVLLRGLSHDDVGHYIEAASQSPTMLGLVEAIYSQSEGNPLYLTELVNLYTQQRERLEDTLPEGIREVIGRRLDELSTECNRVLTVASVIGRGFEFDQLIILVEDISEDRLLEALEEALGVSIIEEQPGVVGGYQFTHALIQRTLRDELSTTRRVRLHARIAETFEKLYEDDLESHAMEIAYHFGEAEAVLGGEGLVRYSSMAGEQALAAYSYE